MKVALIGSELEENLGLRYLHASLAAVGHEARIFDFHREAQAQGIMRKILEWEPGCAGLSMVFTGRAGEFARLAGRLRAAGFAGHIAAGGHFASLNAERLLSDVPAIDSVVHGEGEEILAALVGSLEDPARVPGITFRPRGGGVRTTPPAGMPDDLDSRPPPTRPECFHRYLGIPIANMLGSRGCYGRCSYCSITAWSRQNPGRRLRQRAPDRIAEEMASLYHERGVRIFNFHDDNFFLRDRRANIRRFLELRRELEARGVHRIALQVKARPDGVDAEAMSLLREMGLFRVFLGVESNTEAGLRTLGRKIDLARNHAALGILLDMKVQVSFNLLMFDPETTLPDLRENIAFLRACAGLPLNFGRVEVYSGTPLESRLRRQGRLLGSYFGYTYRIADEASQRAFEMFKEVFLPRNFGDDGMNLRAMQTDYYGHLLRHFFPARCPARLEGRVRRLIGRLNTSSAELLEEICRFAGGPKAHSSDAARALAAELALERERFDERMGPRMDALLDEMRALAAGGAGGRRSLLGYAAAAAAVALVVSVTGCRKTKEVAPSQGEARKPASAQVLPEPAPAPEPQPEPQEEDAEPALSAEQVKAVSDRIAGEYQEGFNLLALKHAFVDKTALIELTLGAGGKVTHVDIDLPRDAGMREFEKDLRSLIEGWSFPAVEAEGICTVSLKAIKPPEAKKKKKKKKKHDWHMCEYMMSPMDKNQE